MITTHKDLKCILREEKKLYYNSNLNRYGFVDNFCNESDKKIWKFQRLLRIEEYLYSKKTNVLYLLRYILVHRKKNKVGILLGLSIPHSVFDSGLRIYHYGSIVVNGNARVGKNCKLHGNNCIGNKGISLDAPIIGDNVDIGYGACIIGGIRISSNKVIGANSVVNKSYDSNKLSVLVGVPAKEIIK